MTEGERATSYPAIDDTTWELEVRGTVADELSFSLSELRTLGSSRLSDDFDCLEGWTDEDLTWRGIPARDLIARADPTAAASHALVRSVDGDYACSFELERLAEALLALDLDGQSLPLERGGPARLVLPNDESHCYESVKWVSAITVLEQAPAADDTAETIATARLD